MGEESPFQQTTRQGIESRIAEYAAAGDMVGADRELDHHPYGRDRTDISLEAAKHIASQCTPVRKVIAFSNYRKAA